MAIYLYETLSDPKQPHVIGGSAHVTGLLWCICVMLLPSNSIPVHTSRYLVGYGGVDSSANACLMQ